MFHTAAILYVLQSHRRLARITPHGPEACIDSGTLILYYTFYPTSNPFPYIPLSTVLRLGEWLPEPPRGDGGHPCARPRLLLGRLQHRARLEVHCKCTAMLQLQLYSILTLL